MVKPTNDKHGIEQNRIRTRVRVYTFGSAEEIEIAEPLKIGALMNSKYLLVLILFLCGCTNNAVEKAAAEREKNEQARHNEMMAELEAAHFDRLEEKLKALRKQQSDMEDRRFELMFEK